MTTYFETALYFLSFYLHHAAIWVSTDKAVADEINVVFVLPYTYMYTYKHIYINLLEI